MIIPGPSVQTLAQDFQRGCNLSSDAIHDQCPILCNVTYLFESHTIIK